MTCITDLQFSKHRRADHQGPHILYMGSDLLRPARGSLPASYLASQTDCDPPIITTVARRNEDWTSAAMDSFPVTKAGQDVRLHKSLHRENHQSPPK